jgi:hypothetical protein
VGFIAPFGEGLANDFADLLTIYAFMA